jgi:predicted enzyme related to lactoylglutathione lyase
MGRIVHFEIHADDVDRAERFYTGVFGWTVQRIGGPADYRLLTTGPDGEPGINGAIMARREERADGGANAYVCTAQVDDLEATIAQVTEGGGELVGDRIEVPHVGTVAHFRDTEGNVFGALQPV